MKGPTLLLLKRTHLYLSVFFSPLLLLFLVTGVWQTITPSDDRILPDGWMQNLLSKFSEVHMDSHFPHFGPKDGSDTGFKVLIVTMSVAFILSVLLGWILAWQTMKQKWLVAAVLLLGVLVPVLLLWLR
jgi:hypothetical protein